MSITRRTLLVTCSAVAVAAAVGSAALILSDQQRHTVATLERVLGPLRIQKEELRKFLDAFLADMARYDSIPGRVIAATSSIATKVLSNAPVDVQDLVERYERRLVTAYVTWTDHSAGGDTTFLGNGACLNPFAVLGEE